MGKVLVLMTIGLFAAIWVLLFVGVLFIVGKFVKDHGDARKYQELLQEAQKSSKPGSGGSGRWTISYTAGGKKQSIRVDGSTEGEAIRNAYRKLPQIDKILEVTDG